MSLDCKCKEGWILNPNTYDGKGECINPASIGFPNKGSLETEEPICTTIKDTTPNTPTTPKIAIKSKHYSIIALCAAISLAAIWAAVKFYKNGIGILVLSMLLVPLGLIWVVVDYIRKNP